ncbi:HEPN domain-containing protein [Serinicoccus chungangensis]|uniref:HEPN domain-containing protein n=1 Tax=Serinicoccus chungangensis TaxID=767452 RepID=UPI001119860E|nr:HEPN domain-containing protein [Serinicoccus chungangensis]
MYDLAPTVRRLSLLSKHFMPNLNKPVYTPAEEDAMHAFRLLAHAELERLVEQWAERMNQGLAKANARGLPVLVAHQVLLHFDQSQQNGYPPRHVSAQRVMRQVGRKMPKDRIVSALNAHSSLIERNNGVSQKDLLKLFLPIGVDMSWFNKEHKWLDAMDALASARGEVAHGGLGVRTAPTPKSERSLLVEPVVGLRRLGGELRRLNSTL